MCVECNDNPAQTEACSSLAATDVPRFCRRSNRQQTRKSFHVSAAKFTSPHCHVADLFLDRVQQTRKRRLQTNGFEKLFLCDSYKRPAMSLTRNWREYVAAFSGQCFIFILCFFRSLAAKCLDRPMTITNNFLYIICYLLAWHWSGRVLLLNSRKGIVYVLVFSCCDLGTWRVHFTGLNIGLTTFFNPSFSLVILFRFVAFS